MIRVVLPHHLRTLAGLGSEIQLDVPGTVSQRAILDALESKYPVLRGTIREHGSLKRRPLLRFYACEEDRTFDAPEAPVPEAVVNGQEPFIILGSVAGG